MKRQLVAILACDVPAHSPSLSNYETETKESLQACFRFVRESVADHNGRPFHSAKATLMAEFDNAVDAVRCALALHEFTEEVNMGVIPDRQLLMRIGVLLGDEFTLRKADDE